MHFLPAKMRTELRRPLGKVFADTEKLVRFLRKTRFPKLIAVGDVCAKELMLSGIVPDVVIIDKKTRRKKVRWNVDFPGVTIKTRSRPSVISDELIKCIMKSFGRKTLIDVTGEEDLAVLPVIKYCPANSIVVYGLWFKGVVAVKADEKMKLKVGNLLERMNNEN